MKYNEIYPFYGAFSALEPRSIPKSAAGDHLNSREEDGSLRFRYGFRNLASAQSGFSAVFGLGYLQGFSGTTENEEYVTAETVSSNTRFYSRNVSTGAATEITNSGSSVNVNASEWVFVPYDDDAFFINPANTVPIYKHTIGTNNSLTAIAIPTAPSVAPTYVIKYGGGSTPYTQLNYAGCDPSTEITYTGSAHATDSSLEADNSLLIGHDNPDVASSFEIDLNAITAGVQDYTYNDRFAITLTTIDRGFRLDPTSIRVSFRNNDGSPKALYPDKTKVLTTAGSNSYRYLVQFSWSDKNRADFDNIRYLKVEYTVEASDGDLDNRLRVSPMWEGGIDMTQPAAFREPGTAGLFVYYTYYFNTPGFESGLSPVLFIPNSVLAGYSPGANIDPLGVQIEITMTVSSDSNVDNNRIYVRDNGTLAVRRVATQADSDLTYDLRLNYVEITRLTEYQASPFTFENVTSAFAYKGSMVWLYKGGSSNVRFSRIGDPLRQASETDPIDDTNAGESFTLADNAADEPLGGIQAGDGVMIAGKYGIYTMLGDRPVEMIPPRRISGSQGVAGKYGFTRFKDDNGITGMAYITQDGQVLFSIPGAFNDKEVGGTINLTNLVRDGELSPKDFLLDEQASALSLTDFSTCQVFVDEQQDALWIVMGLRAMVLRRANLLSGARYWEHYEYTTGSSTTTIRYCSGSGKRRLRWIRSDGKFDEAEYNSSTRAYISGSNSDGGSAAPAGYWESKVFVGPNRRVNFVAVERDDYTDTPTVTVYSSRTTAGTAKTLTSGEKGARFNPADQGEWYKVRVSLAETYEPIRRLKVEEFAAGRRRNA